MLYGDGALLLLENCKNNAVEFDWVDGRRTVGEGGGGGVEMWSPPQHHEKEVRGVSGLT